MKDLSPMVGTLFTVMGSGLIYIDKGNYRWSDEGDLIADSDDAFSIELMRHPNQSTIMMNIHRFTEPPTCSKTIKVRKSAIMIEEILSEKSQLYVQILSYRSKIIPASELPNQLKG
jgi:hypothetical protein